MSAPPLVALRDLLFPESITAPHSLSHGTGADTPILVPAGLQAAATSAAARDNTQEGGSLTVYLATSGRQAEKMVAELRAYSKKVLEFPSWETLPHERLSPGVDTQARRVATLHALKTLTPKHGGKRVSEPKNTADVSGMTHLVVPVRALLQPVNARLGDTEPIVLHSGDECDPLELAETLTEQGYRLTEMVMARGEISRRGDLLDVFVPTAQRPIRIEFFGDTVDEIRSFSLSDQRGIESLPEVQIPPCAELPLTAEVRQRAGELVGSLPGVAEMLEQIAQGIRVAGMESLLPVLTETVPLTDYLPEGTLMITGSVEQARERAEQLTETVSQFADAAWEGAMAGARAPIQIPASAFLDLDEIRHATIAKQRLRWLDFSLISGQPLAVSSAETHFGRSGNTVTRLKELVKAGWRVVLAAGSAAMATRLAENFQNDGTPAQTYSENADPFPAGRLTTVTAQVQVGFEIPQQKLACYTETDVTGRAARAVGQGSHARVAKKNRIADPLSLKAGDYVVHELHGVGRFLELRTRTTGKGRNTVTREYLLIEYAPNKRGRPSDLLWVPSDQLDMLSRYAGSDNPALSRMGGSDWAATKRRARKATKEIAAELIRIYAARQATKGHAYPPDTPWQRELEDSFAYRETPDQLTATSEVKADMELPIPMDRLLTGDVGYGKTEVAVRAAFKAIQDGRQVALLVPTTLLARQHFETFSDRYAPFPVNIAQLSRFSTKKESDAVKAGIADGSIDLVVGTHTLLSGRIKFKNLGLVIIDEEQRFGVEHKETLKALRTDVDVLAMSATPIPRTLEMAVTGIRQLSNLATPPEDRYPILTYVGARTPEQIKSAITRELLREGQVFFVHNRVQDIGRVAAEIAELVPQARVTVAHGQLPEAQLERVMVDFWNREYDVLVCTTIIETGLDIANANTLIVDNAERMGLSQLHQLRGRVGRSHQRGYAYFLYDANRPLTQTAHERLATIAANTDLGAGAQVAMKDLEIRGAGNLLGAEQSGQIAGVGFDLYIRMMADAVAEFNGQHHPEPQPHKIELPVNGHIPPEYISSPSLRLEMYHKVSAATSMEELEDVRSEFEDRYGQLPYPVKLLLAIAEMQIQADEMGIRELVRQGRFVRLYPFAPRDSQVARLNRLYPGTVIKPALRQVLVALPRSGLGAEELTDEQMVAWVLNLLAALKTSPSPT